MYPLEMMQSDLWTASIAVISIALATLISWAIFDNIN